MCPYVTVGGVASQPEEKANHEDQHQDGGKSPHQNIHAVDPFSPVARIATLDLTNGLAIEDTTIASAGGLGPLAKSLPGIIKPADRHPSSVSAGGESL